jgi:hypothetical protein
MDMKPGFQIRRFASLEDMKADEYAYWQAQPAHARMAAVTAITEATFRINNAKNDVSRLQRSVQHVKR